MFRSHKRIGIATAFLLVTLAGAGAHDVAVFANLGFSDNSEVFMFAQYGLDGPKAFADVYTINVPRNNFVGNATFSEVYEADLSPGQDGIGALFTLLPQAHPIVDTYHIDHLNQGRLIYLLVNGQEPKENLIFRDFETGNRYNVTLIQESGGTEDLAEAAFYIQLELEFANGARDSFRIGRPGYFREQVDRYQIKQILLSPDERSLVFLVEKIEDVSGGKKIRYMVETVRFR